MTRWKHFIVSEQEYNVLLYIDDNPGMMLLPLTKAIFLQFRINESRFRKIYKHFSRHHLLKIDHATEPKTYSLSEKGKKVVTNYQLFKLHKISLPYPQLTVDKKVLYVLLFSSPCSQNHLKQYLGKDNVIKITKQLEKLGYLNIDKKVLGIKDYVYCVTDKGKDFISEYMFYDKKFDELWNLKDKVMYYVGELLGDFISNTISQKNVKNIEGFKGNLNLFEESMEYLLSALRKIIELKKKIIL